MSRNPLYQKIEVTRVELNQYKYQASLGESLREERNLLKQQLALAYKQLNECKLCLEEIDRLSNKQLKKLSNKGKVNVV